MDFAFIAFEFFWYLVFFLTIIFASKQWGVYKSFVFFAPAILWGWVLEFATMAIFERYTYGSEFLIQNVGVPLNISLAWASLIFISYFSFKNLAEEKGEPYLVWLTALPLVIIDLLIFEPLAYFFGFWTWTPPSIWFGSPIGNIFGWLLAISLFVAVVEISSAYFKKHKLIVRFIGLFPALGILQGALGVWVRLFGVI